MTNKMAPTTQPQTLDAGTPSTTAIDEVSFHSGNTTHRPYIRLASKQTLNKYKLTSQKVSPMFWSKN